jgi:predicted XRE-type DNA-binding protein
MSTSKKTRKRGKKASAAHVAMIRRAAESLKADTISRRRLATAIVNLAKDKKLSRDDMAAIVGDAPSQMSMLMNGHYGLFSLDRLAMFYVRLGGRIDIELRDPANLKSRKRGRVTIREFVVR